MHHSLTYLLTHTHTPFFDDDDGRSRYLFFYLVLFGCGVIAGCLVLGLSLFLSLSL